MKDSRMSSVCAVTALTVSMLLFACNDKQPSAAENVQSAAAPVAAPTVPVSVTETTPPPDENAPAPVAQASSTTGQDYSPEALETLLAPVALYPDAVLAQVLASSTNPQEVLDAGNWLVANPDTKGKELDAAAIAAGFTPPMLALIQFPTVVDMMCMEMDWTTDLGAAFQADEPGVLDAVQRLRKQAAEMGNLQSSEQMKVTTAEQNDQQVILVQPANPEVIYVPQYNPTAVYTTPAPVATSTTTTSTAVVDSGYSTTALVTTGLLSFGAGMLVNEVFNDDDDDDDYYSPNWGYGGGSSYYPPPYYPRYGNGFRPANGYNRPPNYQHGFNNNNIYVNADGKDYFNTFEGGKNNYRKNANSPISAARPNRPELAQLNQRAQNAQRPATLEQAKNRQVQGNYAGAEPGARPNVGAQRPAATSKLPKGTYAGATNPAARQKLNSQAAGARDRGHTAANAVKPAARAQQNAGKMSKPAARPQQTSKAAARKAPASSSNAFKGSRDNGNAARAASNRGRASMQKSGGHSNKGNAGQNRGNSGQKRGNRR